MQNTAETSDVAQSTVDEAVKVTQDAVQEVSRLKEYIQENIPNMVAFGIKVIFAIIFFCIGRICIKWVRKVVKRSLESSDIDVGIQQFIDSLLKFLLYFLLIFSIATQFGVDAASVAALIASAGVAVGLALQGSLSNFAGGVLILVLKPFKVGDYIIEDSNKNEGTVKEIQIFYTKLTTLDNKTIVIPNSLLTNNSLTNVSEKEMRQLDLKIGISYDSNLKKAKHLLECILEQEDTVLKDEERSVFVSELADSAVQIGVRAWVKNEEFWPTRWRMLETIKLTFDDNGIEIPYPQMSVHMQK